MTSHRSLLFLPLLLLGLFACQAPTPEPVEPTPDVVTPPAQEIETDLSVLTPTEEDIIRAFHFEVEEEWLDAAILYDKLAQSAVQPERSAFLIKIALMYYRAGLYDV
jgi:hypothetical protein